MGRLFKGIEPKIELEKEKNRLEPQMNTMDTDGLGLEGASDTGAGVQMKGTANKRDVNENGHEWKKN